MAAQAYFSPQGGIYTIEVLGALALGGYLIYEYNRSGSTLDSIEANISNAFSNAGSNINGFFSDVGGAVNQWISGLNPEPYHVTPNPYNQLLFNYNQWPEWMKNYYNYVGSQSAPVIVPSLTTLQQGQGEFAGGGSTDNGHITELEDPSLQFTGSTLQEIQAAAAQLTPANMGNTSAGSMIPGMPQGGVTLPAYTPPSAPVISNPVTTQGSSMGGSAGRTNTVSVDEINTINNNIIDSYYQNILDNQNIAIANNALRKSMGIQLHK